MFPDFTSSRFSTKAYDARYFADQAQPVFIIAASFENGPTHFWSGTGLSTDRNRSEQFNGRSDAFCEWNEHAEAFPGWEARIIQVRERTA